MPHELDDQLRRLLVGTNEQRRRTGQALHHLYRTLVFWSRHERPFLWIVRSWAAGGAAIFAALATTLSDLPGRATDVPLRRYVREVLERLADDLERGDGMLLPFLRWLEGRFPPLTEMMQAESESTRIHDHELALLLARGFVQVNEAEPRSDLVDRIRETARRVGPV